MNVLAPRTRLLPSPPVPFPTKPQTQIRHATFLRRPHRPYTFTQLITLSDGSTYTSRTTSPLPIYKSAKDSRNTLLWQPSLSSLRNVELDEAGKLRAFRDKFGRGWDVDGEVEEGEGVEGNGEGEGEGKGESYLDLISGSYKPGMAPAASKRRDGK